MTQLREESAPQSTGPIEGSRRLGPLRPEQLQRALQRFGCGDFVSAEPIPYGLFGQNVFVTSTTGKFVLRGSPHYDWQFPKELYFCNEIKRQTLVPVPYPYLFDATSEIFGWPYILMPRMPGKFIPDPAINSTLTKEDHAAIAVAMGEMLAELHNCRFPHSGEFQLASNSVEPLDRSYSSWVLHHLRRSLDNCAALPGLNPAADLEWAWNEFQAAAPALDVPFDPCAVMHDFREGNATLDRIGGRWRVTGVFDLMEFYVGDGEADLSRQAAEYLGYDKNVAAAFVQTYRARCAPRPRFAERFRLHLLADRLTIWDYGIHHGWFKEGQITLRSWLDATASVELVQSIL